MLEGVTRRFETVSHRPARMLRNGRKMRSVGIEIARDFEPFQVSGCMRKEQHVIGHV